MLKEMKANTPETGAERNEAPSGAVRRQTALRPLPLLWKAPSQAKDCRDYSFWNAMHTSFTLQ